MLIIQTSGVSKKSLIGVKRILDSCLFSTIVLFISSNIEFKMLCDIVFGR